MTRIVADHRAVEPKKTDTVKRELSETRLVRATAAGICVAPVQA
jgi:hypothetical protein